MAAAALHDQGDDQALVPILIRQVNAVVAGVPTRVLCQAFADQVLLIVSQTGKIGYLTQVTMHPRPSHLHPYPAFDLTDDAEPFPRRIEVSEERIGSSDSEKGLAVPLGFDSASLLGTCQQQQLFGTHPAGQGALYELYGKHIAARFQQASVAIPTTNESQSSSGLAFSPLALSSKPVVVGLALRRWRDASVAGKNVTEEEEDDDDNVDLSVLASQERERFEGILRLVGMIFRPGS